ncbi:hypothetical protein ACOME3_006781 [Neoechinorhynchus agilis]
MVRVTIKGGIWRNTEDEILKAAVMKYGKNQWSRIASLLHRKSAKQCKARWFEWLDPSIKKTEWSREEDEKLLHMAKLMPTQWRTIAPVVGRTAAQCLERYEFLLDQVQKKQESELSLSDSRSLRPGEIDPNPETKPARPDPVDMDEDELEMLSEARARLANTQGKKAKRKARERQLEEARRLASLQKKRELRAAGIVIERFRKKKKPTINYNEEIPFEKNPPIGFYDTSLDEEYVNKADIFKDGRGIDSSKFVHPMDVSDRVRQEAVRREKQFSSMTEDDPRLLVPKFEPVKKRSKLVLPSPQIDDSELEGIVKYNMSSNTLLKEAVDSETSTRATENLLSDYAIVSNTLELRTPQIPEKFSVMNEAANILALSNVDTPLKGGQNVAIIEPSEAIRHSQTPIRTPNTVFQTPIRKPTIISQSKTPSISSKVYSEPELSNARDVLMINQSRKEQSTQRRFDLNRMPAPRNDYEIVAPDDDNEKEISNLNEDTRELDAEEIEENICKQNEHEANRRRALLSASAQRGFPIPSMNITLHQRHYQTKTQLTDLQIAEELIRQEMIELIRRDNLLVSSKSAVNFSDFEGLSQDELDKAREDLELEMDELRDERDSISEETFNEAWIECYQELFLSPSLNRFTRLSTSSRKDRIEAAERELIANRAEMAKLANKASGLERKANVLFGGYKSRASIFERDINDTVAQIDQAEIELRTYEALRENERLSIMKRLAAVKNDVQMQVERERQLQARHRELVDKKESFQSSCGNNE